jgi:hypothetical protein
VSLAFALLAASAMAFSCTVDPPRNIWVDGTSVKSNPIGLPPEMNQWKFDVALREGKDAIDVDLNWPGDPILAGKATAGLAIGPQDYSFVSFHSGPCLFTKTACMFMYTLSVQQDGNAQILVQPAALASTGEWSKPFQVYMTGRCTPKKAG